MANSAVDKLKALGLRQGEKVVVGIAATVLLVAVGYLATSATIETTPDALQKKADAADSNLNRKQEPETILTKIVDAGIVDPGFVKVVEAQTANTLKPGDFRARLDWVTPEPGAGLIREQPDLIAPAELLAFPGRGGALLYVLDEKGERVPDPAKGNGTFAATPKSEDPKKSASTPQRKANRTLAGSVNEPKAKTDVAKAAEPEAPSVPGKEETFGKRWIVITGTVDNELLRKNWLAAVKNPAFAFPQYVKVDAERQIKQADGSWTPWTLVDEDARYKVLDNLPEADPDEPVPLAMRPEALVDPLPFLRAGYWTGVHVARLVPDELRNPPSADENPAVVRGGRTRGKMGMMGMGSAMGMGMGMGSPSQVNEGMGSGAGVMGGMAMGGSEGMMGGAGGQPDEPIIPNNENTLMFRFLDFTVEPNSTYRYRIRLVVKNPNFERSDVNPGVDVTTRNLSGPWSEPTGATTVPPDVSIYAQTPVKDLRRDDVVSFRIYRWDPAKGETVVKTDDAAPGLLVGETGAVQYPSSEGTGPKNETIDFNSRSFVLDATGGPVKIPDIGFERNAFTVPAVALIVEPDGGVVVRSQARDNADEIRKDMEANYNQALSDSGRKREPTGGRGGAGGKGGSPPMGPGM